MNKHQDFDTTIRIPVITDLVRPGDPEIIRRAKSGESAEQQKNFEKRLKQRIEELQSAAGQDEYAGLARAHAIRSERNMNSDNNSDSGKLNYEQHIDKHRGELIKELSSMLK